MIITEDFSEAYFKIKAYDENSITVNEHRYNHSLVVSANTLITDWPPQSLDELNSEHWQSVLALKPDIILLGTGRNFALAPHAVLASIYAAHVGIESMNTSAACRTYMALVAEGRHVVAALLIR